ncbi:MAG: phosphate ABC transporter ATP-binding protein PstB [Candidatus Ratteibacteria bacterium]|jgi:phosphate transport system ATP-binding protein
MVYKIETESLNLYYGKFQALRNVDCRFEANRITALIGPSGCGKSTFLRCLNRMNDLIPGVRTEGRVIINGQNIYANGTDLISLRKKIGMVFQRPNPFPLSVRDNVTFGLKIHNLAARGDWDRIVEESLRDTWLWRELKDGLQKDARLLPLDQQQRLCLARIVATKPEIILLDEPCSTLDPIATEKLEELMRTLKLTYTIVIVTHNMDQAVRISDSCGFFLLGDLVEFGTTEQVFEKPADIRTEKYITGHFG